MDLEDRLCFLIWNTTGTSYSATYPVHHKLPIISVLDFNMNDGSNRTWKFENQLARLIWGNTGTPYGRTYPSHHKIPVAYALNFI